MLKKQKHFCLLLHYCPTPVGYLVKKAFRIASSTVILQNNFQTYPKQFKDDKTNNIISCYSFFHK